MSRIELTDTTISAIFKMSEGNPGAANVCMELLTKGEAIDPDNAFGGMGSILLMDTFEIYASKIWQLYKDICGQKIPTLIVLLRATQMGFIFQEELKSIIEAGRIDAEKLDELVKKVRAELPNFKG